MKRLLFIFIILTTIIGLSAAGYYYTLPAQPQSISQDPAVEIMEIGRETLVDSVNASGRIEPTTEVEMKFETGGIVAEVRVKTGQVITAGAILARLQAADLEFALKRAELDLAQQEAALAQLFEPPLAEKVTSAQAAVAEAQIRLAELQDGPDPDELTKAAATLRKAEVTLKEKQWAYDQVAYLGSVGAMPQANALQEATIDYETALAQYNLTIADQTTTPVQLAEVRSQLAQAQATLAELQKPPSPAEIAAKQAAINTAKLDIAEKQRNLEKAVLMAPTGGTVVEVNIEPGERTLNEEDKAALIIANTAAYLLKVEVDEIDIGRIEPGQPVTINFDAIAAKTFQGRVAEVSPRPVSKQDANAIVTYEVTLTLDNDDPRLLTGMTANAAIEVKRHEDAVVVPNRAIQVDRSNGKPLIYVEKLDEQGQVMRVEVELGSRNGEVTQVVAGLEAGDQVVVKKQAKATPAPSL